MLNVIKEGSGSSVTIRFSGSIDETTNFDTLIGAPAAELIINCKEVLRINSVGVKAWIKYFQACSSKGVRLRLVECSVAVVEQINLILNFVAGGTVESIYVPFSCISCKSEWVALFKTEDLRKTHLKLPELKCTKCGGKAAFDDIPEEYLGFVMR